MSKSSTEKRRSLARRATSAMAAFTVSLSPSVPRARFASSKRCLSTLTVVLVITILPERVIEGQGVVSPIHHI